MSDKSELEKMAFDFADPITGDWATRTYMERGFKAGFMKAMEVLETERANVSADALMVWGGAIQFLKSKAEVSK